MEVTNDLQHAKIFVSVLGGREEEDLTLAALNRAKGLSAARLGKEYGS